MKISRRSWHYRYLNKLDMIYTGGAQNLCTYCQKLIIAVVLIPLAGLIVLTVLLLPFWWWVVGVPLYLAVLVGMVDIVGLYFIWREHRGYRRDSGKLKHKEPSLVVSWLKARKAKICPLVEYTE